MNIAVLCGGISSERDVSLTSGSGVARALRERGHRVLLLDIFLGIPGEVGDPSALFTSISDGSGFSVSEEAPDIEKIKASRGGRELIGPNVLKLCACADICFLALHGDIGENGKLQALLDIYGIRYTGSGYLGSAIAMNKSVSKALFKEGDVATPEGITLKAMPDCAPFFGFPCVVKPCSGGSSVATAIVKTMEEYMLAMKEAFRYEDSVLVERYIKGREFTCGVMAGKSMPVIEIIPKSGFYDYKNKYQAGATEEICPANIPEALEKRIRSEAEKVFSVLKIDCYCRVDFLLDEARDIIYTLEANTLPGMTPTSLIPQMAEAEGRSYGELCEKIIEVAMEKYSS